MQICSINHLLYKRTALHVINKSWISDIRCFWWKWVLIIRLLCCCSASASSVAEYRKIPTSTSSVEVIFLSSKEKCGQYKSIEGFHLLALCLYSYWLAIEVRFYQYRDTDIRKKTEDCLRNIRGLVNIYSLQACTFICIYVDTLTALSFSFVRVLLTITN